MEAAILEALAVISAGMMTGNELCVSVFHAQLRTLEERAQFDLGQKSAAVFGKIMPPWYAATLLLTAAAAYILRGSGTAAILADASVTLWLLAIVYTITRLVPVNARIARWTWDTRPADWAQQRQGWGTQHRLRVALLFAALALLTAACLLPHAPRIQ